MMHYGKIALSRLAFLAMPVLMISSCKKVDLVEIAKESNIQVKPDPLVVKADSVAFDISGSIPTDALDEDYNVDIILTYEYNGGAGKKEVGRIKLKPEDMKEDAETQRVNERIVFAFDPNEDGMEQGTLVMNGEAVEIEDPGNIITGIEKGVEDVDLAEGIITTVYLRQESMRTAVLEYGYNDKPTIRPIPAEMIFRQGRSVIRSSEKRDEDIDKIREIAEGDNAPASINIEGSHSPEGTEALNAELANDRAEAVRDYLLSLFPAAKRDSIKVTLTTKTLKQTWEPFKRELKNSSISATQQEEVLTAISGGGSFEEQEDRLKKLSCYSQLMRSVYPKLRTGKITVNALTRPLPREEIIKRAEQIAAEEVEPNVLTFKEKMFAASAEESTEEKIALYKQITAQYDDRWEAFNNFGALHIELAKDAEGDERRKLLSAAKDLLEKANEIDGEQAAIHNNLGLIELMNNKPQDAYRLFKLGKDKQGSGAIKKALMANMGSLEIKYGKYDEALKSLQSASTRDDMVTQFNFALAQVLSGQGMPQTTLQQLMQNDEDMAVAHYLMAVVYARKGDVANAIASLKNAVKRDAKLKTRAKTDIEFRNMMDNADFKAALQ